MKKITFTHEILDKNNILIFPKPADKDIPEWYKKTNSYINEKKQPLESEAGPTTSATVKRCMPVFDSFTAGYFLYLHVDVQINLEEDGTHFFQWASQDAIGWHSRVQFNEHPAVKDLKINRMPKINSPWSIKTPLGTSCLFLPPMHRDNVISILPGIVDTDKHQNPVNFPFVVQPGFEGLLPAGTPIVQVIPFKRDSWAMEIGEEEERKLIEYQKIQLATKFFDRYKSFFWSKKHYK